MNYLGDILGASTESALFLRILWGIGMVGLALVVLQGVLGFVTGHDGDADSGDLGSSGHGAGGYLSLKGLSALLIGLGFGGAVFSEYGFSDVISIAGGLFIGVLFAIFFVALMRFFHRLSSDGTVRLHEAIGKRATVYMRIPAGDTSPGEVQVSCGGRLMNVPAFTRGPELPTGTEVLVIFTHGEAALEVEKLPEEILTLNN